MRIASDPLRVTFDDTEVRLLTTLLDELDTVVAADDAGSADDPVRQRLFPSAYPDDGDAEADYRSITEQSLRDERGRRIAECAGELAAGGAVDLDAADAARRWIQVLNDLRLALGTRLGVTEERIEIDPTDPDVGPWLVYDWLTAVQETVVTALMR